MTFKQRMRYLFGASSKESRAARGGKQRRSVKFAYIPKVMHLEDRRMLANFMVTSLADNGAGSLREAITASVTNGAGTDLIQFSATIDGGTINLTSFINEVSAGSTMAGPSAFFINANTSLVIDGITGLSQGVTIARSGAAAFRLFHVSAGSSLTLQSLTLSGGLAQGFAGGDGRFGGAGGGSAGLGGAIFNQGSLTLLNSTLSGNTAQGGVGGSNTSGPFTYGGAGGAGLGAAGGTVTAQRLGAGGGGPNGGAGSTLTAGQRAVAGGFGGGGGGGGGTNSSSYSPYYDGARGGFGGGGGGGGWIRGFGGVGGFGGGGGGSPAGTAAVAGGYGGGNGSREGVGGGGAGMGGAIFNEAGTVFITNSTFTGNAANGGGIGTGGSQNLNATGGKGLGGGLFNRNGAVTVMNSTFSGNTVTGASGSTGNGRDVFNLSDGAAQQGTATIQNSILGQSGSTAIANFVSASNGGNAPVNAGSNNLMSNPGTFPVGGFIIATDPLLGPLQNNGGLTKTMAPVGSSPAVDGGIPAGAPTTDQRGWRRDPTPDIGAFEILFVGSMVVNVAADEVASDGFLSIREAINVATGAASYSTLSAAEKALITPVAGSVSTVTFASSLDGQIIALSKFVNDVSAGSTMAGPSAFFIYQTSLVIDGQTGLSQGITITRDVNPASYPDGQIPSFRLFDVANGSSLTLESLTLSNGRAQGFVGGSGSASGAGGGSAGLGGAIFNQGSLTIANSTISGNTAQGGAGGSFQSGPSTLNGGAGGAGMGAAGGAAAANSGSTGGGPNGGSGGTSGAAGGTGGFAGGGGGGGKGTSTSGAGGWGGFGAGGGGAGNASGEGGRGGFGGGGGGASGPGAFAGIGGYGGGYGGVDAGAGRTGGGGGAGMGGAIFNEAGTVIITNSTITGNAASGGGGGTAPDGNGTAGEAMGGALFNHNGSVTISSSTISGNTAADGGRGIFNLGERYEKTTAIANAIISIRNSIVGQSDTSVSDLLIRRTGPPGTSQSAVSGSFNLIRTITNIAGANSLTGTVTGDPKLGALAAYGGLTSTMELLPGSAATDAGDPSFLPPPDFDQRGASFPRVSNGRVDIGAFEVQPIAPPSADYNGDGIADGSDFLAWQRGFGVVSPNAVKANGDADNDRDVDADDLAVWKDQFGSLAAATTASESVLAPVKTFAASYSEALSSAVAWYVGGEPVTDVSTAPLVAPATLPLKPPARMLLTSQLADAALAAQHYGTPSSMHRESWKIDMIARKQHANDRHSAPVFQLTACDETRAANAGTLHSSGLDIADEFRSTEDDFEQLLFDGLYLGSETTRNLSHSNQYF